MTPPSRRPSCRSARPGKRSTGRATAWLVATVMVLVPLAGCSPQGASSGASVHSSTTVPASRTDSSSTASSARAAAGIPDCPAGGGGDATSSAEALGRAVVGEKLPDVVLSCIGGDREVSVRAALAGRPHVINLWASWCRPCRAEAPMLRTVSRQTPGVGFLGIDYGDRSSSDGISFAGAAGWRYPQLEDPDALTRRAWGVTGLPVTLLVAGDGTVVSRVDGAWTSAEALRAAIRTDLEAS